MDVSGPEPDPSLLASPALKTGARALTTSLWRGWGRSGRRGCQAALQGLHELARRSGELRWLEEVGSDSGPVGPSVGREGEPDHEQPSLHVAEWYSRTLSVAPRP